MSFENLPKAWSVKTLEEIAQRNYGLVDGPFGSNLKSSEYTSDGVPIIRGSNLSLGGAKFDDSEFVFISEEKAHQLERSLCYPNDIIFTKKGTLGQTGLVPQNHRYNKFLLSSNQMKLSVDGTIADPVFVYYFVSSPTSRAKIVRDSEATGVPKTNLAYLRTFPIPFPPLKEQKAIAAVLSAFDDKIELNRQMNATLEEMARALFKSWFVDFDPVRRNQARQPNQPYDHLFPGRLVVGGNGRELPEGWRLGTVGEDFDITMGQSPPGDTYNEEEFGLPFYQGRRDFGFRYPSLRVYCSEPNRLAKAGDTLVSVRAPVGDINMAIEDCCIGRGVGAIRHKSGSRSYTFYAMKSLEDYFDKFEAEGTVFGSLNKNDFHKMEFLIPSRDIVKAFEQNAFAMDQLIETNEQEMLTLADLRDTLLPRLMSGQLRVPSQIGSISEIEPI